MATIPTLLLCGLLSAPTAEVATELDLPVWQDRRSSCTAPVVGGAALVGAGLLGYAGSRPFHNAWDVCLDASCLVTSRVRENRVVTVSLTAVATGAGLLTWAVLRRRPSRRRAGP